MMPRPITGRGFSCRALNESKPKAPFELSVNHTETLNESKYKKKGMYYVSESINEPELCGQGKRNEEILGRE